MKGQRTALITGGNRGIGYALVEALARSGWRVIFTARDQRRGAMAHARLCGQLPTAAIEWRPCDLASPISVRALARELVESAEAIDALVHNAGVLRSPEQRTLTPDGVELTLATNTLGPLLLTRELLPGLIRAPHSRVVSVTSRLHTVGSRGAPVNFDFDDPYLEHDYHRDRAYKNSKLALIWVSNALQRRLPSQITSVAVCPGFVPSTAAAYTSGAQKLIMKMVLPRLAFATSVAEAAANLAWAVESPDLDELSGVYVVERTVSAPSPQAQSLDDSERFWSWAEDHLGLPPWPVP